MTQDRDFQADDAAGQGLDPETIRRVAQSLRAALGSAPEVSPELDARILHAASGRLGELRRRAEVRRVPLRSPRWRWAPALATAAAVLLLVWAQFADRGPAPGGLAEVPVPGEASRASDPAFDLGDSTFDLDGTGRVDVLDAFFLARRLQQGAPLQRRWDVDGDGRVARGDVDRIARAAVRVPARRMP